MEITASFRELDILIFRSVFKDFTKTPLNVSKITLSNLEFISHMGSSMDTSGSIGNVTVCDLASTTKSVRRNIFAVGDAVSGGGSGVRLNNSSDPSEPEKALVFTFDKKTDSRNLTVHMAAAYYVHNSKFMSEMAMCAGDYKQYAFKMAKSIQVAASDMAKSMVVRKRNLPTSPQKAGSEYGGDPMAVDSIDASMMGMEATPVLDESGIIYSINIKSPVIVFPKDNASLDLLVGHLGKIRVSNAGDAPRRGISSNTNTERIRLEIEKINVSMLNISEDGGDDVSSNATTSTSIHQLLSAHSSRMVSLLNNTDLLAHVERITPQYEQDARSINVLAQINTEIKLFLSVPVYQQILATLKYTTSNPNSMNTGVGGGTHSAPTTPISSSAASSDTSLSTSLSNERLDGKAGT
jgi:hypothetical protein